MNINFRIEYHHLLGQLPTKGKSGDERNNIYMFLVCIENIPIKIDVSHGLLHLPLTPPPPSHTLKNEGPPLKCEVPFQCVKKFIFSKFASCRLVAVNFATKWTPSKVFFDSILSLSMLAPCIDSSWPIKFWRGGEGGTAPMFSTPVGNPGYGTSF